MNPEPMASAFSVSRANLESCGIPQDEVEGLYSKLHTLIREGPPTVDCCCSVASECSGSLELPATVNSSPIANDSEATGHHPCCTWQWVARQFLRPQQPWQLHEFIFATAFSSWNEAAFGPPPVWLPTKEQAAASNLGRVLASPAAQHLVSPPPQLPDYCHAPEPAHRGAGGASLTQAAFRRLQRASYDRPELYWPLVFEQLGVVFDCPPRCVFSAFPPAAQPQSAAGGHALAPSPGPHPAAAPGPSASEAALPPAERAAASTAAVAEEAQAACRPGGYWLPGAAFNIAAQALRMAPGQRGQAEREGSRAALLWRGEEDEGEGEAQGEEAGRLAVGGGTADAAAAAAGQAPLPLHRMSLAELQQQCSRIASALRALGLSPTSRVAVVLPLTAPASAAYLALLLLGASVVAVPDSFASEEIAVRLRISAADAVLTQDALRRGGKLLPLYSRIAAIPGAPRAFVLRCGGHPSNAAEPLVALRPGDLWWDDVVGLPGEALPGEALPGEASPLFSAPALPAEHPCHILFSSGTTGAPKAIPWSQLAPLKAAADAWAHQDVRSGDVLCWPTSLGWMMGPWLLLAGLLGNATVALYHGAPTTRGFARFVQDAGVTVLGLVPSLVRAWRSLDCTDGLDWSRIRCFSSTGEASSPPDSLWLMSRAGYHAPIIEYCGGTEIGGAFLSGCLLQPQALSAFSTPAMGCRVLLLREAEGEEHAGEHSLTAAAEEEQSGAIVVDPLASSPIAPVSGECALMPRMLGSSFALLNKHHGEVYFRGMPAFLGQSLRRHGDAFIVARNGFWRAHGRTDDTMNLGGIKVGSVEIERVCNAAHPAILETAAVSVPGREGGPELLHVAVVLKKAETPDGVGKRLQEAELRKALNSSIQKNLNPLFKVANVTVLESLPRNASNKVLRRKLRDQLTLVKVPPKL